MKLTNQKDEERYKLGLKAHIAYKNPHTFKKYYSGGPNKPLRDKPFYVTTNENYHEINHSEAYIL